MNREWSVTLGKQNVIEIRAKKKTRCVCGTIVVVGSLILWDKVTKHTVGCAVCHGENPDAHYDMDDWADYYPIFHE